MEKVTDSILDTIVTFLDTCPSLENIPIEFGKRETGENETVRMITIVISGEEYLVVAKKVGG